MVLIYYKDKETGKVLSFVEAAFSTVEMAKEFDCKDQFMDWLFNENYESIDVSIRCYLLTQAISEVLPEYTEEFIESHADLVEFEEE